ncbi:MAG: alpha/beta hydrolase [Betaproteobacteria bacterium]|nr:alpha/beta hydrolase [Betaproteobacteria bacterium]
METVVLIHGLWFSGWSMSLLRHRLLRAGYRVKVFSYPTVSVDLDANARALARFATGQQGDRLHFVAHSLGGLVLLTMLRSGSRLPPGRAVLLGSPIGGSRAVDSMARWRWTRSMLGRSILQWHRDALTGVPRLEIAVIAGGTGLGLGCAIARLPLPHDGTVAVDETRAPLLADHLVLPVTHSGLLVSRTVAAQICHFLRDGHFHRHACTDA